MIPSTCLREKRGTPFVESLRRERVHLPTGREWTATIERGDNELKAKESEGRIIFGSLSADYESPINPIRNFRPHKMALICDS